MCGLSAIFILDLFKKLHRFLMFPGRMVIADPCEWWSVNFTLVAGFSITHLIIFGIT